MRNLNRRSLFWRYQEERDRLRSQVPPRRSSSRNSRGNDGGGGCGDSGGERRSRNDVETPTSIVVSSNRASSNRFSIPIDIPSSLQNASSSLPNHRDGGFENNDDDDLICGATTTSRSSSSRRSCSSDRRHQQQHHRRQRRERSRNRHTSLTDHGRGGRLVNTSANNRLHHHQDNQQQRTQHRLQVPGSGLGSGRDRLRRNRSRSPTGGGGGGGGEGERSALPSYEDVIMQTSALSLEDGKTSWKSFLPPPSYQEAVCLASAESPTDARWHASGAGGDETGNWVVEPPEVIIIDSPSGRISSPRT